MRLIIDQLDLSGFDELAERGTLQRVVMDLAPASRPQVQRLAAGQRDPQWSARLVEDCSNDHPSRGMKGTRF